MDEPQKRQIALKVRISDILNGRYVKEEGWQPNYILAADGRKISRVNLIATLISIQKETSNNILVVDDGTGTITLRSFGDFMDIGDIGIGTILNVIGKPREFGQEKYILPEIIKALKDERWAGVRSLELGSIKEQAILPSEKISPAQEEVIVKEEKDDKREKTPFQRIYDLIKEIDKGDGADVGEVSKRSDLDNAEEIINTLLKEGEIFEIRRGRLKVLD